MRLPSFLPTELSAFLTPTAVGISVGALVGIVGIVIVIVLATRPRRVVVPPYPLMRTRNTPLPPPWACEPSFVPSTELSARALQKMGFPLGPFGERLAPSPPSEMEMPIFTPTPTPTSAPSSASIIRGIPILQAAPIDDLQYDDSPTEIGETWFDTVAPPRSKGSRPKIRAIRPLPPRFPTRSA